MTDQGTKPASDATPRPLTGSVYLASRYSRWDEMRGVRDVLTALCGVEVTSRWIDHHGGALPTSIPADALNADPGSCTQYAVADWDDLAKSDTVISFTCGSGGKGGRHVEFGIALALGKRCIVVGPREHVFHTMPQVEWYPDWPRLVMALTRAQGPVECAR